MTRVYLAGPITGTLVGEAIGWREYAMAVLLSEGHISEVASPMRGKDERTLRMDAGGRILHTSGDEQMRGDVARDRHDVAWADVLLVNLVGATRVSIGTMVEYGWADALRKVVVTVMEPGNIHDHPFIREVSSYVVQTLDEGLDVVLGIGAVAQ